MIWDKIKNTFKSKKKSHKPTKEELELLEKAEQLAKENPDKIIICPGFGIIH